MGCDTLALSVVDFVVAITMHSPALARLRSPNSSGALRTWPRCVPTGTVAAHRPRLHTIVHALEDDDEEETVEYEFDEQADYDDFEDDPTMRLYLDCADHKEWEKWAETGIFYGFTTNPTILKRDGIECTIPSMRKLTRHAFDLGMEELQLQAWGSTMPELYSCGLDLIELDSRVVVKIPMTMEGIKAARRLIDDGVSVTMTAVHSVHQAATGMALGAAYIAPYLGRMNDAGKNGYDDILKMQTIVAMSETLDETSSQTRLLVASIRSAEDISILAAGGCDTFTVSPLVANQLVSDPMTLEAAELFQEHALEMGAIRDQ